MKQFILILCLLFILLPKNTVSAQFDMAFYCDVMANAFEGKNRVEAGHVFKKMLHEELSKNESFSKSYPELKWVSFKGDQDKTFRIITWQVKNDKNIYQSYGYIQTEKGQLIELKDNINSSDKGYEYEIMDPSNWYGALYYNIKETTTSKGKAYLLFGYDGFNDKDRMKVIEVLSFENDKPVFGAEIFKIKDGARPDLKSRILVDYSSLANVNCNYNEGMEMIVHDFVQARMGVAENGGPAKIPDGTYVGYKFDGKYWSIVEQIAHQVSNPNDIFYQPKSVSPDKKDIFGKKAKN